MTKKTEYLILYFAADLLNQCFFELAVWKQKILLKGGGGLFTHFEIQLLQKGQGD